MAISSVSGSHFSVCSSSSGSCVSASRCGRASVRRQRAADLPEVEREQVQRHELRRERLGRRDADLGPGVGVDRAVGLARRHAADDVADRDAAGALLLRFAQRGERVGRLARLRDHDRERVLRDDRIAVAELGSVVDLDRNPRELSIRNLPTSAACQDVPHARIDDALDLAQHLVGNLDLVQEHLAASRPTRGRARSRTAQRLLVDLLEHEVLVAALLRHDRIPRHARALLRDRAAGVVGELDARAA